MKYQAVIFDVDGTLLDTTEGVLAAVSYTIEKHHLKELPLSTLKKFIGPPIQYSFAKFYGISKESALVLAETFRQQYKSQDLLKAEPYRGIFKLLQELKAQGTALGVATYKRQDYALKLLEYFGFPPYMTAIYGSDMEGALSKRDLLMKCQKDLFTSLNTNYAYSVMIGDSDNDALAAKDIPMDFIGVTYGFGFETALDVNRYPNIGCAHSVHEIKKFL